MAVTSGLRGWSGAWGPGRGLGEGRRAVMKRGPGTYSGRWVAMFRHRSFQRAPQWWNTGEPSCFRLLRAAGARGRRVRGAAHLEHGLCGERMQEGEAKKVGGWGCGGADRGEGAARAESNGVERGEAGVLGELLAAWRLGATCSGPGANVEGHCRVSDASAGRAEPDPLLRAQPTGARSSTHLCLLGQRSPQLDFMVASASHCGAAFARVAPL